eukprot:7442997-Prorocentrum_lima.AAC.1
MASARELGQPRQDIIGEVSCLLTMLEAALPRAAYVKQLKRKLAAESSKLEGLQDQFARTSEDIGQAEDEIA